MANVKVKVVSDFPVRFHEERYEKGAELEVPKEIAECDCFEIIEKPKKTTKKAEGEGAE